MFDALIEASYLQAQYQLWEADKKTWEHVVSATVETPRDAENA